MFDNPFYGNNKISKCFRVLYDLLIARKEVTYADIIRKVAELDGYEISNNTSPQKAYSDINDACKKACQRMKRTLNQREKDCFRIEGDKRHQIFRYVGKQQDPLADLKNQIFKNNYKQYATFCENSLGLVPEVWLDYFFKDTIFLFNIKRGNTSKCIFADVDRQSQQMQLLPILYQYIIERKVVKFDYIDMKDQFFSGIVFHPHILKEFENQWYLCGYSKQLEDIEVKDIYYLPIERINADSIEVITTETYREASLNLYETYWQNTVGLRRKNDVHIVQVRTLNLVIDKLLDEKQIHSSQKRTIFFSHHEDGEYGEFEFKVDINSEFIGSLLRFGAWLQVIGDESVKYKFANITAKMAKLYEIK